MTILFYKVCEPYGCFSNFSPHAIYLDNNWWPTSEHYYQAQKFVNTPDRALILQIRCAPTPEEAATLGRQAWERMRSDWQDVKLKIMYGAVWQKFSTHLDLQEILLSTGHKMIIENSPIDDYWGCGTDGTGKNHLGHILMQIRSELSQGRQGRE